MHLPPTQAVHVIFTAPHSQYINTQVILVPPPAPKKRNNKKIVFITVLEALFITCWFFIQDEDNPCLKQNDVICNWTRQAFKSNCLEPQTRLPIPVEDKNILGLWYTTTIPLNWGSQLKYTANLFSITPTPAWSIYTSAGYEHCRFQIWIPIEF